MIDHIVTLINGEARRLLRLEEMKDGTVNIAIRHAKQFTYFKSRDTSNSENDVYTHPEQLKDIKNQYYSIHPSPSCPDTVRYTHHIEFVDGTPTIDTSQVTVAVKDGTSSLVFACLCQDFSDKKYGLTEKHKKGNIISLGTYMPIRKTLVYFLIVSPNPSALKFKNTNNAKYIDVKFQHFTITILYTFLSQPSSPHSEFKHLLSAPPYNKADVNKPMLQTVPGLNLYQIYDCIDGIGGILSEFIAVHGVNSFFRNGKFTQEAWEALGKSRQNEEIRRFAENCKPSAKGW